MGYHITLVRSPVGPIPWEDLAAAGQRLGWEVDAAVRELWRRDGGAVVARVIHDGEDGPWTKSLDDAALSTMIALGAAFGARARGDELESCRTPDDWYVHRDDRATRTAIASGSAAARAQRARRQRIRDIFRLVVLAGLCAGFGVRIWSDMR